MFIKRDLSRKILAGAKQVPVIAIVGPRQSGKSTLAKELFKKHIYLDMQDAELFDFATSDPKGFLQSYANEYGIIIDEAQYVPQLFAQIKVEADKNPQPGYYVLSGSQNFLLHEKISESLSGRAYFYHLLPLSIHELKKADLLRENPEECIFKGFYPRVYQPNVNPRDYYQNYLLTYVERDIRMLRNIENILTFQKFIQLCALRIGTTINFNDLATNCGISVSTAKSWLSLLKTSFIIFLVPSYHENLGKRITKSPKLYFYDTGLAAVLMNATKEMLIKQRSTYGALFENMMIVDIMKNLEVHDNPYTLTFFRSGEKQEIDVIIETIGKTIPVEIKASQTMQSSFFETIRWFGEQINAESPIVIYGGTANQTRSYGKVVSWIHAENITK